MSTKRTPFFGGKSAVGDSAHGRRLTLGYMMRILAWNGVILLTLLVLLEITFGSWFTEANALRRLNLLRNVSRTYEVAALYDGAPHIRYERDAYGFRGAYPSPDQIDILTIGGSTTDQRYIDEERTWQAVLARNFANAGRVVHVVNAGVDGHSSVGHLAAFDYWFPHVPNLQASACLLYVGLNDLYLTGEQGYDRLLVAEGQNGWARVVGQVRRHSILYSLYRTVRGSWRAYRAHAAHRKVDFNQVTWVSTPTRTSYDQILQTRLSAYEARLNRLVLKAKAIGCQPIFATQPLHSAKFIDGRLVGAAEEIALDSVRVNGLDLYLMMQRFNEATRQVAEQHDVRLLEAALGIPWTDDDFYDFAHNTPAGAQKLGDYFFEHLRASF